MPDLGNPASIISVIFSMLQNRSEMFAAIAGDTRSDLWMRQKFYQTAYRATMWAWFSNVLEKAFVSRVKR